MVRFAQRRRRLELFDVLYNDGILEIMAFHECVRFYASRLKPSIIDHEIQYIGRLECMYIHNLAC